MSPFDSIHGTFDFTDFEVNQISQNISAVISIDGTMKNK